VQETLIGSTPECRFTKDDDVTRNKVKDLVARRIDAMDRTRTDGDSAYICVEQNDPVLGTPGLAFWGGATLVAAFYDAGRMQGG
jgi:hypothetical protein